MNEVEIIDKLTSIARIAFEDETLSFDEGLDATRIQTWNSLSFMNLLAEVESEFEFRFKMMEILQIQNLGDIVAIIKKQCDYGA